LTKEKAQIDSKPINYYLVNMKNHIMCVAPYRMYKIGRNRGKKLDELEDSQLLEEFKIKKFDQNIINF
jgi:predicted hydrocarbon binding protein